MYLERVNDTDGLQTSVYIYTFVFTGTYTGPFCHNPVESRLIPLDSSSIPLDPADSCGIRWNPAEWMHSCRNLWGIKKYSMGIGIKEVAQSWEETCVLELG